jgi:predicted O-linked N-acetylglucosamine transferase (SPINDLY family)
MSELSVAESHVVAALELIECQQFLAALDEGQKAVEADPRLGEGYLVVGIASYALSDQGSGIRMVEHAHELNPDCREIAEVLATMYSGVGRVTDALYFTKLAMALQPHPRISGLTPCILPRPEDAFMEPTLSGHYLQAVNSLTHGRIDAAISSAESELRVNPHDVPTILLLARALMSKGEVTPALAHLQAAAHLDRTDPWIPAHIADCLLRLGRYDEAAAVQARVLRMSGTGKDEVANDALAGLAQLPDPGAGGFEEARAARNADIAARRKPKPRRDVGDRALVGEMALGWLMDAVTLSPELQFTVPVFSQVRKDVLNIVYCQTQLRDMQTRRLKRLVLRWQEVRDLDDWTLSRMMAGDEIDVLVDATSLGSNSRRLLRASKPAPLVVKWLGTPFDPDFADVIVSGPLTVESDRAAGGACLEMKALYPFEFITNLPEMPQPSPSPVAAVGTVTFGGVLDLLRLTPQTVAAWAQVLEAVPGSQLLLGYSGIYDPGVEDRALQMFAHFGQAHRIILWHDEAKPDVDRRVDFFRAVDVMLDTLPNTVGADVCEALWMGVPSVTLAGRTRAGLMSASGLHAAGLKEWIAKDVDDYVGIAARLACDEAGLARHRADLRDKLRASPLCDGKGFFADLVAGLRFELAERSGSRVINHS